MFHLLQNPVNDLDEYGEEKLDGRLIPQMIANAIAKIEYAKKSR